MMMSSVLYPTIREIQSQKSWLLDLFAERVSWDGLSSGLWACISTVFKLVHNVFYEFMLRKYMQNLTHI